MELEESRDRLFGKLLAYKMALDEAIKAHPDPASLAEELAVAKERGAAVWLGEPLSDWVGSSFEEAMDEISASLPARSRN